MAFAFKRLVLFTSIAAALAADKEPPFHPPAAAALPHHVTNSQLTIGVEPYVSGDKLKAPFGKLVPYQYGVLPVLVCLQNDSGQTITLKGLQAEYVGPNGDRVRATAASEVKYARAPSRPAVPSGPISMIKHKNPLDTWEIEGRALSAEMLPAGATAFGFLYFETGIQRGATLYLSGIAEAKTGKELLFFEIPIE
jgi:hypothetical protein